MDTTELLRRIREIEIRTEHLANDMFAGQYQSAFRGHGMEFAEVRQIESTIKFDAEEAAAADAMNLPFGNCTFDAVTIGFGVRNFGDVRRGLEEIRRVLRPGGQVLVLEFFRDDPDGRGQRRGVAGPIRILLNTFVPLLGRFFGRDGSAYSYLPSSMDQFLTTTELVDLLTEYGFVDSRVERQTFGIAHIVGAVRP